MAKNQDSALDTVAVLEHVRVNLAGFPALLDLSLEIKSGELTYISGPNGAGKTTLLRVIAGLVRIDSGEAQVLKVSLPGGERLLRPKIGLVSHQSLLYEDLTVRENLKFQAKLLKLETKRMEKAMDLLGVSSRLADQVVSSLSSGQKKRVSLCALLMKNPPIWLLDEPHASLDKSARILLDELIFQACARGTTILISSHEQLELRIQSSRRVLMVGGRIHDLDQNPNSA